MESNERYNYYKRLHPEWSDEQIWTAVSIDMQTAQTVKNGGEDLNINDPQLIADVLRKAGIWLKEVLPHVFEKIGKLIDKAIASVVSWAKKGVQYVIEIIGDLLNE